MTLRTSRYIYRLAELGPGGRRLTNGANRHCHFLGTNPLRWRDGLRGDAQPCPPGTDGHDAARAAYLARFPDTQPLFGFADFSLFRIVPRSVRFVGGFAQAWSITGAQYAQLMSSASTPP